ncbi:unnamed protein product [Closterium sp. Naga37s-1]|nr:unnamed protein product [Closterium sp. Naga37s-1]
MIRWLPLADPSPLPSPSPFACLLWLPMPAPLRAPGFRPPFCPLGNFLLICGAPPSALPTLPPVPIVASAARAPFAPPPCPSRAAAAFLAMVTRRLPSCCAASGVQCPSLLHSGALRALSLSTAAVSTTQFLQRGP